jgi:hypothetical protein
MLTKPSAQLTLFDTLSRLTFIRATKLLGAKGDHLIAAGGQLLTAAFTLLGEMIPQRGPTNGAAQMASELKACLDECLERDEQGRARLTVTLPNEAVLENLARTVASLLTARTH